VFRIARASGHVAWWIFVVATLFAGGVTWLRERVFVGGVSYGRVDRWLSHSSYVPEYDGATSFVATRNGSMSDWFGDPASYSMVAFIVVAATALVEALVVRRLVPGLVTVAVPFVALVMIASVTPFGFWNLELRPVLAMAVVLAAVAVREMWVHTYSPAVAGAAHP
jgi:hypothetical protein